MSVQYIASAKLPTRWGDFTLHGFEEPKTGKEHVALTMGDLQEGEAPLCRIHSECLTGDCLFSMRCDCGSQLELAMQRIAEEGRGLIVYLRQEGRGIGLLNKIRAYSLQDAGADTVEANVELGFEPDGREYEFASPIFSHLNVQSVRLMTNNPRKVDALKAMSVEVTEIVPIHTEANPHNESYLAVKFDKLGHLK